VKRLIKKFPDQPLTLADAHGLAITSHRRLSTCWSTNRHLGITGVTLVIKRTHQSDSIGAAREQSRRPGRSAACESGYETPRHKVKRKLFRETSIESPIPRLLLTTRCGLA